MMLQGLCIGKRPLRAGTWRREGRCVRVCVEQGLARQGHRQGGSAAPRGAVPLAHTACGLPPPSCSGRRTVRQPNKGGWMCSTCAPTNVCGTVGCVGGWEGGGGMHVLARAIAQRRPPARRLHAAPTHHHPETCPTTTCPTTTCPTTGSSLLRSLLASGLRGHTGRACRLPTSSPRTARRRS